MSWFTALNPHNNFCAPPFMRGTFQGYICLVGVSNSTPSMARTNEVTVEAAPPKGRPKGKKAAPLVATCPNTRSSANIATPSVPKAMTKTKALAKPIAPASHDNSPECEYEGDILRLEHLSFVTTNSFKLVPVKGPKHPIPWLRKPDAPVDFDHCARPCRRNDAQSQLISPFPPLPPISTMCSSDEDNDAVQDALDEFSNGHFDEPEDSDADLKLLCEAKTPLPSSPTPTHTTRLLKGNTQKVRDLGQISSSAGFGTALNQALGPPSSLALSSSFHNEDYIEAVTDAISMAADDNEQAALLARKLELIEQKQAKYAGDAQSYFIKEKMESHSTEWTEMANELGIEPEDVLQYVYQHLYGAENPGHGLSLKELSTLYKQEKAQVAKKGKECLEEWFRQNLCKLEEIEGAIVWNSMSASSCSKMMAKTVTDMSKKSQVVLQNFQYELFRFVMNREVLDGQAMANAYIFLSSKATARILDKHIWSNMELHKKLQLDLINVEETPGDDDKPPHLRCGKNIARHLPPLPRHNRAAISAKMMHCLRSVFEQQGAEVQLSQGFPWNNLANFIYTNHPSFTIRNWPSTVPYSWVGEMNSRQVWLLLQSLVIGFIYEEKNSNERILKPNSRIVFEPFNPSNEDCKSPDFRNVMLISDEKGRPVMRICDSSKWQSHKALKAVGHEKGSVGSRGCRRANRRFLFPEVNRLSHDNDHVNDSEDDDCPQKVHAAKAHSAMKVRTSTKVCVAAKVPLNKMKDAQSTKSHYRSASEDRANDSSDDDKYDNGNDSEAQPIRSKCGSIKEHVSRRNSDRRASKIKGKELKAHSQKGQSTDETKEEAVSKAKAKGKHEFVMLDNVTNISILKDVTICALMTAARKKKEMKTRTMKTRTMKMKKSKQLWGLGSHRPRGPEEFKGCFTKVHNEWKKVGSSHKLPQASPSPKVNSQACKVEKVGPPQGFKKSAQVPTKEKSAVTGKDVKKCHIDNHVPSSPMTEKSAITQKDVKKHRIDDRILSLTTEKSPITRKDVKKRHIDALCSTKIQITYRA
ncbi:hypothetical protein BS47DRAFT_1365785 [Hydnum rufescens UP504]|uniref:Uncharacterized protein n=1 Tax=Hydnum rufescens UP504 TaxID=1448309 RepID=A0A9P6DRQ7_9AGAM|nr:hypothetical protein BS47DRAFT_1365785 [Hydnum rufescens UP504]